ncbi:MAG: ATP-dependent DNA helicase RecG [Candidatus Deianiraeaceae bacterium]|jgi:ATP-dependent DNA helicase RecG
MAKLVKKETHTESLAEFSPVVFTPVRYDVTNIVYNVTQLNEDSNNIIRIIPVVHPLTTRPSKSRPYTITAYIVDESHKPTNSEIQLTFFAGSSSWWNKLFPIHTLVVISGKPKFYGETPQISHPKKIDNPNAYFERNQRTVIIPKYKKSIIKIDDPIIQRQMLEKISQIPTISQKITDSVNLRLGLDKAIEIHSALQEIHRPIEMQAFKSSQKFLATLEYVSYKNTIQNINHHAGMPLNFMSSSQDVQSKFPFALTHGQLDAIDEISKFQMSEKGKLFLLQGDVGCGKTIVAITVAINAVKAGYQVAVLAPTNILAIQLHQNFSEILQKFEIKTLLITGKDKAADKRGKIAEIANGDTKVIIGTHAVFSKTIEFHNLGFVIIDEQHKFGVNQRLELMRKSADAKCLLMTATPIPRTLSMSMYSGIEYYSIKEKPQNRLPINTTMLSSVKAGEIVVSTKKRFGNDFKMYWVCPLIDTESDAKSNIVNREKFLLKYFSQEEIVTVHGKMKENAINDALLRFKDDQQAKILLATTIVEVGIDVPKANIIVIESAENFGLASLHQLRGRVGRNAEQGYCILLFEGKLSEIATKRLQAMKESNDGFYISEVDRKLRGSGNVLGKAQSGVMKFTFFDEELYQDSLLQLEEIFLSLSQEQKDEVSQIFKISTDLEFSYN